MEYEKDYPDVEKVRDNSDKNKYEIEIEKKFEKTKDTNAFKRELRELDEKFKNKMKEIIL